MAASEAGGVDALSPVKRALLEIRRLRDELDAVRAERSEPVAIVGIGCRFPGGANSPDAYWDLLAQGRDAIVEIPPDRWDVDAFYDSDADAPGKISTRFGGFLAEVDKSDPAFFGISPREADSMDPQQRILLEVSWEALEHAAIPADGLRGSSTGVFIGIGTGDYAQLRARGADFAAIDAYFTIGSVSHSVASGRLAYFYGFQGPTLSVDTACSSSLVALHLAVQALRREECSMALAGGVGVILAPDNMISLSKAHMLAPDGRCKTFDARADGFSRGEGCGVVVLKRLRDAQADGDRIIAVVRGSAVNQDGRSTGLTVPNGPAQEKVIRTALADAGVGARDVCYVEAHGTGTSLGDPIELGALTAALCEGRPATEPLLIGSVKTNIGHLEAAAGIAGIIKVALALDREEIPGQLYFETPNPHFDWAAHPISVVAQRRPWPDHAAARVCGVSSFGFSGTNAHIVLSRAPRTMDTSEARQQASAQGAHVLTMSAKTPEALTRIVSRYESLLAMAPEAFADICFSANVGRSPFAERCVVVARDGMDALTVLQSAGNDARLRRATAPAEPPRVAFLYAGQGCQYPGMGKALYESQPIFKEAVDRCAAIYEPGGTSLTDAMFAAAEGAASALNSTRLAQPALFALEYGLTELWRSWGVRPAWVIGHSLGEYAAAVAAGVLSLEDGMRIVAARARLIGALPNGGAMAAIAAAESVVRAEMAASGADVAIAAANGPLNTVVSGAASAVNGLIDYLGKKGIESRRLEVSHAFHSALMDPVLDEFEAEAAHLEVREPAIGFISNVTGQPLGRSERCNARYWRNHLRHTVRFADGIEALASRADVFLEIGPGAVLAPMARAASGKLPRYCGSSLRRSTDDSVQIIETLADLWTAGVVVDWKGFHGHNARRRVDLPTYSFDRERHWAADARPAGHAMARPAPTDADSRWRRIVAAGSRQAGRAPMDLDMGAFPAKWEMLDRMTSAHSRAALEALGAFEADGVSLSVDELLARCPIVPGHRKLMSRWLQALADEGWLEREGDRYTAQRALRGPTAEEFAALDRNADDVLRDDAGVLGFMREARRILPAVLKGERNPVEALFPNGSFDLARAIYRDWSVSRYFNGIVVAAVAAAADTGRPIRILEIGAGSGGTAAELLPALAHQEIEYWFTDVSELFLVKAEEQFGEYSSLRYGVLDIEADVVAQGYEPGAFDIIVASNVLHTATDIDSVLGSVRKLLVPGGIVTLFETTREPRWCDVTFGLMSGWQRYERGDAVSTPLLSVTDWAERLRESGFDEFAHFAPPPLVAETFYQDVFVARNAGSADAASPSATAARRSAEAAGSSPRPAAKPTADRESIMALDGDARRDALFEHVRSTVMAILRLDAARPPSGKARLMDLGFDSLMAVELRNRLERSLAIEQELPATLIFDYPSIDAIAGLIAGMFDAAAGGDVVAPARAKSATSPAALDGLSEDEIAAMLRDKLERL